MSDVTVWWWACPSGPTQAGDRFWVFRDPHEIPALEREQGLRGMTAYMIRVDAANPAPALLEFMQIGHQRGVHWNRMIFEMARVPEFAAVFREFNLRQLISNPVVATPRTPEPYAREEADRLARVLGAVLA
jgi:hypothetical protein